MPSFYRGFWAAGLLLWACAAALNHQAFLQRVFSQKEIWKSEVAALKNVAYLIHLTGESGATKLKGTFEMYYIRPDTLILFSPGFLAKGSMRGRWILGDSLLAYFPREKKYYHGSWHRLLLGIVEEPYGLDSLIFEILSLREMLVRNKTSSVVVEPQTDQRWILKDSLGGWQKEHIFTSRGRLSMVRWRSEALRLEVTAKIGNDFPLGLSPQKIKLAFWDGATEAKFEVEQVVLDATIAAAKVNFVVPEDAVPYEDR